MILVHPSGLAGKFVKFVKAQSGRTRSPRIRPVYTQFVRHQERNSADPDLLQESPGKGDADVEYYGADGQWHACGPQANVSLGEQKVAQAGNRSCYVLRRHYTEPENDGVMELTLYIDKQTWLQVGSIVEGKPEEPNGKR